MSYVTVPMRAERVATRGPSMVCRTSVVGSDMRLFRTAAIPQYADDATASAELPSRRGAPVALGRVRVTPCVPSPALAG